jgi:hypothetical protein
MTELVAIDVVDNDAELFTILAAHRLGRIVDAKPRAFTCSGNYERNPRLGSYPLSREITLLCLID